MKTNVQTVKYNQNSTVPNKCVWWSWEEICDDCDKVIHKFRDVLSSCKPDLNENDYCLNCLHKRLDVISNVRK